jgi:SAM-dependent methyltransferase
MKKYVLAALSLKLISSNRLTKNIYRKLGNVIGGMKRKNANVDTYLKRGDLLLKLCRKYDLLQDGDNLLELGTGWLHWYSMYIRLLYPVQITMMDIWDNRQLLALKANFKKVFEVSDHEFSKTDIEFIGNVNSFPDLYKKYDLNYLILEDGSLSKLKDNSVDVVFSFHVLEHIPRSNVLKVIKDIERILKPGGVSIHQIGINDHLINFDNSVSPMNYLRYSDAVWKRYFQNEVQYFNRILMIDWIDIFSRAGLTLNEKIPEYINIETLQVHPQYKKYSTEDLSCINLTIVHQKD